MIMPGISKTVDEMVNAKHVHSMLLNNPHSGTKRVPQLLDAVAQKRGDVQGRENLLQLTFAYNKTAQRHEP